MGIEVRSVGPDEFEEIYPLLLRFPGVHMSKEDWRWTLFAYPWSDSPRCGYALNADGKTVGFIGTIFSARPVLGRMERFCNTSSWYVHEDYRYAGSLLLRPILGLRDNTIVCLTPSPSAYKMFSRLGLRTLENEQLVLPPLPVLSEATRAWDGSFTLSPDALRSELTGDERIIYRDLSSSPVAHHILLMRHKRHCYLVATPGRRKHIPYAEIQYIGNREFFWDNLMLVHAALFRAMGVPGLAVGVDSRFLGQRKPPLALRLPARRLYRPTREDITPDMIDGLYSELMGLRF